MSAYQAVWRPLNGTARRDPRYRRATLADALFAAERHWLDNNPATHPLIEEVLRARLKADPFTAIHWESKNGTWDFWIEEVE